MSSYPTDARPSPPPGEDGQFARGEDGQFAPGEDDPAADTADAVSAAEQTPGTIPGDPTPGDGATDGPRPRDAPAAAADSSDPDPTPGGVADDVAADLAGLRDSPVEDHPDVYQGVHDRLRATLSGIDNL